MEKLWVLNSVMVLIFSGAVFCVNIWVELFTKRLYLLTLLSPVNVQCRRLWLSKSWNKRRKEINSFIDHLHILNPLGQESIHFIVTVLFLMLIILFSFPCHYDYFFPVDYYVKWCVLRSCRWRRFIVLCSMFDLFTQSACLYLAKLR